MDPGGKPQTKPDGNQDPSPRVAHTLTACCRCRTRKTRCDPGIPRCGPCERTNSHCEYYDPTKGTRIPRNYVVHLQHKVRDLEKQLADLEKDDGDPDPEDTVRNAASVHILETNESKYLGSASGTTLTRLVMQLAKQFTDSKSISEIVPNARQRMIKEQTSKETEKPTSKIYPLISNVAAEELPTRDLTNRLVQLFYMKVHPLYPLFHEPTFTQDVEDIYNGSSDPHKNFCLRMVIAISLQKMDAQYAGLADSYYLAALKFMEPAIRPMNLSTLQCFALVGGYSLLTPTRTAVYYQIGLAVRLAQALGISEEKTLVRGRGGQLADPLQIDMRRRLFWCLATMDFGLAHGLGRPATFSTGRDHIDVNFPELVDDQYITKDGILPAPQTSLRKWISIHFCKMRLLQVEIRRKLYQRKRRDPKSDQDPWFREMEAKLIAWRDTSPEMDAGSGLTKTWFIGRYNTMRVFLYRPSPQVPRPSQRAALQCYDACEYNIHLQRKQIETGSVDITWVFAQSIFMAINTLLWSLSYSEVRRLHPRTDVEHHLKTALDIIESASTRWPGVTSALELYRHLTQACMKIYEKDGDIPIAASSPSDSTSIEGSNVNRSRTTSPAATVSTSSLNTPPEQLNSTLGYGNNNSPYSLVGTTRHIHFQDPPPSDPYRTSPHPHQPYQDTYTGSEFESNTGFNPLPTTFPDMSQWNPAFSMPPQDSLGFSNGSQALGGFSPEQQYNFDNMDILPAADFLSSQNWGLGKPDSGLTQEQQVELMQSLETTGTGQIDTMIEQSNALFNPGVPSY
ncbi:hypothetical protein EJ05DRAFT_128532 [Pseudovirgaria hyperparasitica]|uniref:Zn(2)-C6 fungal-type domain-containing protein n=1 Tax=Pseudovirgaria hyperparasitica TaxID=470096 RepID=A0A6A6W2M7_9PEZI|nr:uncharacterized protein EJ05DRAFT_128532 [Pseudovirgaria hyperparasitica]KAF2755281.1 hypothetical protein EJ05DRAFT_128532 [Pseudovirgaria hyperparasitica]